MINWKGVVAIGIYCSGWIFAGVMSHMYDRAKKDTSDLRKLALKVNDRWYSTSMTLIEAYDRKVKALEKELEKDDTV